MSIQVVILAAGQGKRMFSTLPKVLHLLAGKPLLEHVVLTAFKVSDNNPLVVHGHQGSVLQETLSNYKVTWVEQKEQLGTGHALQQTLPQLDDDAQVLVLYGDVPLISETTLKKLIETTPPHAIGMLTAEIANPAGYGRIKRDHHHRIIQIVEEKEATNEERALNEINPGIYFVPAKYLKKWLPLLKNKNGQNEYYLTDIISLAVQEHLPIHAIQPAVIEEIFGINDKLQLATLERFYQRQQAEKLLRAGVTISDPTRLDIRGEVTIGNDVSIDINVILQNVRIGNKCIIGPNTILKNVILADGVEIKANCIIEDSEIGSNGVIGPFARLRPGTILEQEVHVGNFVEIKNSKISTASKINHLSYIGDAKIGKSVNVGAGTITCNYDGANKNVTTIGDNVLVGSDTLFVAPVIIGEGATIGAGSIIVKDAPPHALILTHELKQRSKTDWVRPSKKKEEK